MLTRGLSPAGNVKGNDVCATNLWDAWSEEILAGSEPCGKRIPTISHFIARAIGNFRRLRVCSCWVANE
jgi:hypothetical protein